MRVAYIGNFEPPHSTENDVKSALERLGHHVVPLQEQLVDWTQIADAVTGADLVDLVLWTRTSSLDRGAVDEQSAALRAIRDHVPVVGFHLDLFWGLKARSDREQWINESPYFQDTTLSVTADGDHDDEWATAGVDHLWLPPAIAGKNVEMEGRKNAAYKSQIGFVGSWRGYHSEWPHRKQLVSWVNNAYPRRFRYWEGHVRGQDLADLYATVEILIGDSCMISGGRYWSDRIPETLGRGGFLLHPDTPGLRDHFPTHTLVTWPLGDFKELRYLLDYYLSHRAEAETIAAAGRLHVAEFHTYERRMEQIFDHLQLDVTTR